MSDTEFENIGVTAEASFCLLPREPFSRDSWARTQMLSRDQFLQFFTKIHGISSQDIIILIHEQKYFY